MLEDLSRGKRIDNGEWIEGYYVPIGGLFHYILTGKLDITLGYPVFEHFQVFPETVGRATGVTDKNGVKIFKGDIIEYEDEAPGQVECHDSVIANRGEIVFCDGEFCFTNAIAACMDDLRLGNGKLDCEVIGNIHDNPELLEGGGGDGCGSSPDEPCLSWP